MRLSSALFKGLLTGVLAMTLLGCVGPQLMHHQLVLLDKGLTVDQVEQRLTIKPDATIPARAGSRDLLFQKYLMNNGVQADTYVLAYENGKLLYWGYIDEFRRHPDHDMNRALSEVLPHLMKRH